MDAEAGPPVRSSDRGSLLRPDGLPWQASLQAICTCSAHLLDRVGVVLREDRPYQLQDVDGTLLSKEQARKIIAEFSTVPEEVRKRNGKRKRHDQVEKQAERKKKEEKPHQLDIPGSTPQVRSQANTRLPQTFRRLAFPHLYCNKRQNIFKACLVGEVRALRLKKKLLFDLLKI